MEEKKLELTKEAEAMIGSHYKDNDHDYYEGYRAGEKEALLDLKLIKAQGLAPIVKRGDAILTQELFDKVMQHSQELQDKVCRYEKAQRLYTADEVREYIMKAISITSRNPGIEKDAEKLADHLLPSPPQNS